jgi:mannosyl-oligosaccharide alpha-1,2-mannosidase
MMSPSGVGEVDPQQKWIFNTEAHPLPVFEWSEKEVEEFEIKTTVS